MANILHHESKLYYYYNSVKNEQEMHWRTKKLFKTLKTNEYILSGNKKLTRDILKVSNFFLKNYGLSRTLF